MNILKKQFLPTKTRSVHAATIAFYKGHPVFSWFGGSREGLGDVAIYVYNLNGNNDFITIGSTDDVPRWNPILVNIYDKLFLFKKSGFFCDRWQTFIHDISNWTSDITYKEISATANILPSGLNGPVKTKPFILGNKMFCGSSFETIYDWTSYIELYDITDGIVPLTRSNPITVVEKKTYIDYGGVTKKTLGVIQPSLWFDKSNNKLKAFFRSSKGLNKIYYSESLDDSFMTWDAPRPTNLLNPNSGIDVVNYNDNLYLAYNPSSDNREPLVVSKIRQDKNDPLLFYTEDKLEIREKTVENNPFISRELSYPYMIENNGILHLVYTYGRIGIEHVEIEV